MFETVLESPPAMEPAVDQESAVSTSGDGALTQAHRSLAQQVRSKIFALEHAMLAAAAAGELAPFDFEANLTHAFEPGVYRRTLSFPKGMVIVGKIHKHAHENEIVKGAVLVLTEGGGLELLTGPLKMISPAGTKRALYALQDTVWTTVHLTDETDLKKIEDHVIAKSYEDYERFVELENNKMQELSYKESL